MFFPLFSLFSFFFLIPRTLISQMYFLDYFSTYFWFFVLEFYFKFIYKDKA